MAGTIRGWGVDREMIEHWGNPLERYAIFVVFCVKISRGLFFLPVGCAFGRSVI